MSLLGHIAWLQTEKVLFSYRKKGKKVWTFQRRRGSPHVKLKGKIQRDGRKRREKKNPFP